MNTQQKLEQQIEIKHHRETLKAIKSGTQINHNQKVKDCIAWIKRGAPESSKQQGWGLYDVIYQKACVVLVTESINRPGGLTASAMTTARSPKRIEKRPTAAASSDAEALLNLSEKEAAAADTRGANMRQSGKEFRESLRSAMEGSSPATRAALQAKFPQTLKSTLY
jgi:hypothetical protein